MSYEYYRVLECVLFLIFSSPHLVGEVSNTLTEDYVLFCAIVPQENTQPSPFLTPILCTLSNLLKFLRRRADLRRVRPGALRRAQREEDAGLRPRRQHGRPRLHLQR